MTQIFAETERLRLRALERADLPRYAELIGDWDVAQWLSRVPHPYTIKDAEWWFDQMAPSYEKGTPELYVVADKKDNSVMGAVGFHEPTTIDPEEGELVLGYWIGKPYWRRGYISEAIAALLPLVFARPGITKITTFTDTNNEGSQGVLKKAGFQYIGTGPRKEFGILRGSKEVTRWDLTREEFEKAANKNV